MISIIIINFHQKDFTDSCIESVFQNIKSCPVEIILVNNSPSDDFTMINSRYGNVTVIENVNRGFSQANNLAAGVARGDYLLFLNADTVVKNDFANDLIKSFKDKKFGAVGLKLYNSDDTFQLSFWKENTFLNEIDNKNQEEAFAARNIERIKAVENEYSSIKKVDWVTGAAMFVKKEVFAEAGCFDEDYFLFYEDADLCKRFSDKNYNNYFYPDSNILHYKGENVNRKFNEDTYYFSKESQLLYYKKHNNFVNRILLRLYLFFKFLFLYLMTFKKINLKIFKLTMGIKSK